MFLDEKNEWHPPEPSDPPKITSRGEKVLWWIIGFNCLMLCLAPVGGVTLMHAIKAAFTTG